MNHEHNILRYLERLVDFGINFFTVYAYYYVLTGVTGGAFSLPGQKLFFWVSIVCLSVSFLYGYYAVYIPMRTHKIWYFVSRYLTIHLILAGLLVLAILVIVPVEEQNAYISWIIFSATVSGLILSLKKQLLMLIVHNMRVKLRNIKYILMVTDSQELVDGYMEELQKNPWLGYSVIGYIGNLNIVGLPHIGTTADLDHVLKEYRPDEVVIAFETVRKKMITKYISVCNDNCIKVMVAPAIVGYFKSPRQVTVVGNVPLIDIRSTPLDSKTNRNLKRVFDIAGSLILIVLTSPLMLFTAVGIKLSSPGPILFKQIRVGKDNREYEMYKFRSMKVNTHQEDGWSKEGDARITRFGAFIRKYALDELPQFFNVLKGDMSLVGPRPEVPFYVEKFKKEVPLYMLKHTLRPGITGLAQVKGLRGDTSIQARIDEDINYIENWTFWLDVRILLLTPFRAVNKHERYVDDSKFRKIPLESDETAEEEKPEEPV